MGGEWREVTVGAIATRQRNGLAGGPFGSRLVTADYLSAGVPVIRGQNMGARWVGGDFVFVSEAKAESLSANTARPGDLVFTQRGTLGQVSIVPEVPYDRYVISQSQMKVTVNIDAVDVVFLYYLFSGDAQQDYIRQNAIQTGVPHTNLGILRDTRILIPPLREQRAIAQILGTLDDKIELNRRTSETLDSMAQGLFRSWLKDLRGERVAVSQLIRDGVLQIGDGYRAKNSELGHPGLPFIRAGDLDGSIDTDRADTLCNSSVVKVGRKLSRIGDVVFTSKGTIGRFARVTRWTEPVVYSPQVCYWRSLDPERLPPALLYCWMRSDDMRRQIDAVAGQTDMAPYVSLRDQRMMEMPRFTLVDSRQAIVAVLDGLLDRQALLAAESKTTAMLRDLLLPKLISGELRVTEAEELIGTVA